MGGSHPLSPLDERPEIGRVMLVDALWLGRIASSDWPDDPAYYDPGSGPLRVTVLDTYLSPGLASWTTEYAPSWGAWVLIEEGPAVEFVTSVLACHLRDPENPTGE